MILLLLTPRLCRSSSTRGESWWTRSRRLRTPGSARLWAPWRAPPPLLPAPRPRPRRLRRRAPPSRPSAGLFPAGGALEPRNTSSRNKQRRNAVFLFQPGAKDICISKGIPSLLYNLAPPAGRILLLQIYGCPESRSCIQAHCSIHNNNFSETASGIISELHIHVDINHLQCSKATSLWKRNTAPRVKKNNTESRIPL